MQERAPHQASYAIQTPSEARKLADQISIDADDPLSTSLGLTELLLNAIEHGNAEVGGKLKAKLIESDRWPDALNERLLAPPYCDRKVEVNVSSSPGRLVIRICDEGPGFDWQEQEDTRGFALCGRGIQIAREVAFETVTYGGRGNVVIVEAVASGL